MESSSRKRIEAEVLEIITGSPVPEDHEHALNTLEWVERLEPGADDILRLAAVSHDIERALPGRKLSRKDFDDYDEYKRAHCRQSAAVLSEILDRHGVSEADRLDLVELVMNHEFGKRGDHKASVLKDADSISFFQVCLPRYFQREGPDETLRRMRWGWRRLSSRGRKIVASIEHGDPVLDRLVSIVSRGRGKHLVEHNGTPRRYNGRRLS